MTYRRLSFSSAAEKARQEAKRAADRERHRRLKAFQRLSPEEQQVVLKHRACQAAAANRHREALHGLEKVSDEQIANGLAGLRASHRALTALRERSMSALDAREAKALAREIAKAEVQVRRWEDELGVRGKGVEA